jgi:hypothetical protein
LKMWLVSRNWPSAIGHCLIDSIPRHLSRLVLNDDLEVTVAVFR